ncbi:MAG TPA: transcriptional repressor [Thermomicrobiales bacterium]|nr:transcriptional repressor [Thermomicrobiales bacterium]
MNDEQRDQYRFELPADLRMTPQRLAVLEEVRGAKGQHLTAAEIAERVRAKHPTVSVGTVYRTLHTFAEHGVILEFPFGDQASRFDGRADRHDHVHCTVCGELRDVDVPSALLAHQVAADQTGYAIDGHQTIFTGICPVCQRKQDRAGG